MTRPQSELQPGRPAWPTITVLGLCGFLAALQQTMIVPVLPVAPELLGVGTEGASWLITAALLTGAVATPVVSRAADMYGKKKMIMLNAGAILLGSVIIALANGSFPLTVVGRSLQGFAVALIPVAISIMRDTLPPERVGFAVALMSGTLGAGACLGLPLAGIIYDAFGWAQLFWVSGLLALVLLIALGLVIEESSVRTPGRFDLPGAGLLALGLTATLLPLSMGATWGWGSARTLTVLSAGMLGLGLWGVHQFRAKAPLVDIRLMSRRPVMLTNVASLLVSAAMYANALVTTQQLQGPRSTGAGFDLSSSAAGLAMTPAGLMPVVFAPVAGLMMFRLGARRTLLFGALTVSLSWAARLFFDSTVTQVVTASAFIGIGIGISFSAMPMLIMSSAPRTYTATANGINSLARAMGCALASAAVAAVLNSLTITTTSGLVPSVAAYKAVYVIFAMSALVAAMCVFLVKESGSSFRAAPQPAVSPGFIG